MSITTKKRIRGVPKGYKRGPMSEEHKRKIGLANKGHSVSKDVRERIAEKLRGHTQSEITIQKRVEQFNFITLLGVDALTPQRYYKIKIVGKKHWYWKGSKVKYSGIHMWVRSQLGLPNKCERCGKIEYGHKMHWDNRDHEYKRVLYDWIRLCSKCHYKYDIENGLRKLPNICLAKY